MRKEVICCDFCGKRVFPLSTKNCHWTNKGFIIKGYISVLVDDFGDTKYLLGPDSISTKTWPLHVCAMCFREKTFGVLEEACLRQ